MGEIVTSQIENVTNRLPKARKRGLLSARNVTIVLAAVTILSGCQTPKGSFCQIAKPVRLSSAAVDALTDAEVKALLGHNLKGQKLCGWKAN